jgi:HK97 family phage major capsid protein
MPYNSIISRTDADALIPEEVSNEILGHVPQQSAVLQLARRLANMSRAQKRLPVMSALATGYFVSGDTSVKQTTEVNWTDKYIDPEELAVIVPIPEAVVDDSSYDIWGQIRPIIEEAFGIAIDAAVLYGTNIPATWTTNLGAAGLIAGILAASQNVSLAAYTDLYEAILGETAAGVAGLFGMVEADGFMVTGSLAHVSMKSKLRNVRTTEGMPIFTRSLQGANQYELDGAPCLFPLNGAISSTYYLISGQWNQLVYSMRQDITYKILDQAVIQDQAGTIIYNLAQQDMIALRAVMRLGVALPNPINRMQPTTVSRFPFAYLTA